MASESRLSVKATKSTFSPPYAALALAYYLNHLPTASTTSDQVHVQFVHAIQGDDNVQLAINGEQVVGLQSVLERLGNTYASTGVYGANATHTSSINALLLQIPSNPPTFASAKEFLNMLSMRLTLRTYLVGHQVTLADFGIWGHLKGNGVAMGLLKGFGHVLRWFNHIAAYPASILALDTFTVQSKIKAPKADANADKMASGKDMVANASFDMGLPNAKMGEVVCRFPPEPSGYLHIGHAKAAILNQYFAKSYKGRFLIRFDDTNPSKEKAEFEESIIEDLALLGVFGEKTSYTSDYFDQLHIYAVQLIKDGNAYADDTLQEEMRRQRWEGLPSARRDMSPEDTMAKFAEMATGSDEGARWCIRAKMSVDDPNKALRDPVVYRCNREVHHRTGDKFKMYPTYDFACPIVDCLEGVTHALRTNEYRDRNPQYQWMLTALGLRKVEIWDYGRIAFAYTLLSKRKLKWFVEEGHVRGWDDPRFATVRGIRRRGMSIEAIKQYMLLQGPSQAVVSLEWDAIWNLNKKVIDPVSPRFVALESKDMVKVTLRGTGTPTAPELKVMPRHKKNPDVGTKETVFDSVVYVEQADAVTFAVDEEITLMDWGNAYVRTITRDAFNVISAIDLELHLEGDFKKTKKKITWLSSSPTSPLVPVVLLDFDYLITKTKLEEDDEINDFINPITEFQVAATADHNLATLTKGDVIQFERKGYYIVDKAFGQVSDLPGSIKESVELILIPDGKAANVALKALPVVKSKTPLVKKVSTAPSRIPEPAPSEPVETTLKSEGNRGFDIKVTTKMYRIPNIYGEDGVEAKATTKMHEVKKLM